MTTEVEALLAEFLDRQQADPALDPEAFVAGHPAHAAELRRAIARLLDASRLLPADDVPTVIGGYRVERRLGRGATGEVFAVVGRDGRSFALKRLLPHAAAAARAQQRFGREARVLRDLHHPGIVEVVDVGEDGPGGLPFLVMERIDGMPLSAWIATARERGLDAAAAMLAGPGSCWQRIARVGASIAAAVACAHDHGVLHRDLKPGNVLLRPDGTPVVVDFGLAADASAATLTGTGDVLGTPHYMAPEQARGEATVPASDVHAIGAILFEMSVLRPPRQGRDVVQVLEAARRGVPVSPRRLAPAVPRELDLIVRRAMAFRPRHRHGSAGEMAAALRLVADGGRPIGLTLGVSLRCDEFWRRRRRSVLALGATTFLVLAALAVGDAFTAARAERVRNATIAAIEAHFDGAPADVAPEAAVIEAEGDPELARFLRREPATASDPFVVALSEGRRQLEADPAAATKAFERAVALRPESSLGVGWLGIAAARARLHDVAERELLSAVRALPNSVRLRTELARVLRSDAVGKTAAGAEHLRQAVTLPRATAETWHELAKALTKDKQYEAALAAVDRALATAGNGERIAMMRTKAVLFDALKRHEEGIPLLRSILDVAPTADTWVSYGAMFDGTHRLGEAVAAYREALELEPEHVPAHLNLVYLFTGSKRDECEQCRLCFERDPRLLDVVAAEDHAIELLRAQEGQYGAIEIAATYLRRVAAGQRLLAAIDERLARDLPAGALGRLVRAKQVLTR